MEKISALIFLMLCHVVKNNPDLAEKVDQYNSFDRWAQTQKYLEKYRPVRIPSRPSSEEKVFFRGLDYINNSCYQDTILVSLFAIPNDFIEKTILEKNLRNVKTIVECNYKDRVAIREELRAIASTLRGNNEKPLRTYCTNLRKLLKKCKTSREFHAGDIQDAGEFLQHLFNIFDVEGRKTVTQIFVTNNHDDSSPMKIVERMCVDSPIFTVYPRNNENLASFLREKEDTLLSPGNEYKHRATGKKFSRKIEYTTVMSADYLIFYVQRLTIINGRIMRNTAEMYPPETIDNLKLFSIVVHQRQHYTCYLKAENSWYYYDDNPSGYHHKIEKRGRYEDMLRSIPDPLKFGVLYFYG